MKQERHGHCLREGKSTTYNTWDGMIQRCTNPKAAHYKNYGGRGITICKRWMKFINFLQDMGEKPEGLTLERIDNSKNYSLDNCKWVTRKEQNRNNRRNRMITYKGETKPLCVWAELLNIPHKTIRTRISRKWPEDKLLVPKLSYLPRFNTVKVEIS